MSKIKDAMQDFDDSGYGTFSNQAGFSITKEDDERLTFEKRQEEADGRERDIANGWEPHHD